MGPKKPEPVKDDFWRSSIENALLNDGSWSVQVVMMEVAGSDQDRIYLNKFEVFAAEEKRFVIKNICKSETMFMINQLGGEKKVKDDNLRVFEVGQAYLKEKKGIPPDIQALIVKHLILKMKEEYLFVQKQQLFVRDGMRRESATMIDKAEIRGTVCVPPSEPASPTPPPPGKGKKGEAEPVTVDEPEEGKKYNTLLRVRGEEWRDKVYVDDFPEDGPNLYVAVSGFMEPQLVGCLIKIGVPLTAVFQIRIDLTSQSIPSNLTRPTKRGQSQTDVLIEQSLKFWEDVQQLRIAKDTADDYNNTAFVVFSPPYWSADELSGNPDKIYDELCFLMYDIQDLTRQRNHYLENMDIINIPDEPKDRSYEHYYHKHIDDLPLECCSTYSVLDSILQAVCDKQDLTEDTSKTSLSDCLTLNQDAFLSNEIRIQRAETLINDVFSALNATNSNKKSYRLTYGEESENQRDPIVINFGDFAKCQTFHLKNFNLDSVVFSMLFGMPINRLWNGQNRAQDELETKINFHVNVLLSCFDRSDIETAELNRLLHILACRKLYNNRSSLKKIHLTSITISEFKKLYLKRSAIAEPLPKIAPVLISSNTTNHSFPSISKIENSSFATSTIDSEERKLKYLFDCPDISELISASEIENNAPNDHVIDDFEVFEDFSGTHAFQVLREAFTNFNCLDYKYCEVTDTFNLMFFNSYDHDGIAREEWRSHLPTPVCLQDFFDFVLEEHSDWIQNEENLYEQKLAHDSQSQCKAIDPFALQSCVDNQDVDMEMLIEGSLKYQEKFEAEVGEEETIKASSPHERIGDSESTTTRSTRYGDPNSTKKSKSAAVFSSVTSLQDSNGFIIATKPFQGYDLSERRFEVFGKDGTFYSKDGTRVSSRYSFIIPMNLENIILSIAPGNSYNEFWVHRSLGESVTPEATNACESFRITSKDQVAFYLKKELYRHPISITTGSTLYDNVQLKTKENVIKCPSETETEVCFESKTFHSLFVTWPNGLITETVYEDNSSTLSHIKQHYVVPGPLPHEKMRCISLNGEVIIFKTSGLIEVLRSDGTYIIITKCERRIINNLHTEEPPVVEKNTKGSAKTHGAEKPPKPTLKNSKHTGFEQDDLTSSAVPVEEYELFIDEYEIIETSGLRQQWVEERFCVIEKLLIRTATDYCLGEVFSRRMDGTQILLNKDGIQIVTFPNRTRIITRLIVEDKEIYPEWTEEEAYNFGLLDPGNLSVKSKCSMSQKSSYSNISKFSRVQSYQSSMSKKAGEEEQKPAVRTDGYIFVSISYTIEHENYTSVTVNKANGKVTVNSPNNTSATLDTNNQYEINLDSATVATFNGQDLKIDYSGCTECDSKTTCKIKMCQGETISLGKVEEFWVELEDSFGKKILVNDEGAILLDDRKTQLNTSMEKGAQSLVSAVQVEETELKANDRLPSNTSTTVHGKCRQIYSSKEMRFFVLSRDLTCSELVHRLQLEQDTKACRFQPWCSINEYDTFGDRRSLLTMLSPVALNESEKWIMNSQLSNKASSLKYKDLKKDDGKGFYSWMRPYKRFVPKPQSFEGLTPKLPRAFILRILEKQWKEQQRDQFKGARELLRAVLKYRQVMESDCQNILHVPVIDSRSECEHRVHDIVQALGHRLESSGGEAPAGHESDCENILHVPVIDSRSECEQRVQALGHRIYEDLKAKLDVAIADDARPDVTTKPPPKKYSAEEIEPEEGYVEVEDPAKKLQAERECLIHEAQVAEMSPNLKRYWRRREEEYKEEQFYLALLREGSVPPYFRNVLGGAIWWDMNNAAGAAVDRAERRKMKCACDEFGSADDVPPLPFM